MELSPQHIAELKKLLSKVKTDAADTQHTAEADRKLAIQLNAEAIVMDATAIESRAKANESEALANTSDAVANLSQGVANDAQKCYGVKLLLMRNLGIDLDNASEEQKMALLKELGVEDDC